MTDVATTGPSHSSSAGMASAVVLPDCVGPSTSTECRASVATTVRPTRPRTTRPPPERRTRSRATSPRCAQRAPPTLRPRGPGPDAHPIPTPEIHPPRVACPGQPPEPAIRQPPPTLGGLGPLPRPPSGLVGVGPTRRPLGPPDRPSPTPRPARHVVPPRPRLRPAPSPSRRRAARDAATTRAPPANKTTRHMVAARTYHHTLAGSWPRTPGGQARAGCPSVDGNRTRIVPAVEGATRGHRPVPNKAAISPTSHANIPAPIATTSTATRRTSARPDDDFTGRRRENSCAGRCRPNGPPGDQGGAPRGTPADPPSRGPRPEAGGEAGRPRYWSDRASR